MSGCLHFLFWFCASHYRAFHGVFQTTTVLSKDVYFGNQWSNHIITWEWMNFASVEQWSSKKSGVLHQNKTPVLQQILHIFILLSDFIHFTCDAHLSLFFFSVSHLILLHTVVLHSAVSGQESCECRSEESDVLREAVSWLWWVLFEVVCVDVSCGEEGLPLPCCVYWVWWVTRLGWWTEQCCSLQQCVTKPLMLTQSFIGFFLPSSNTLLADTQSLRVTVQRNYLGISDRIAEMKISHPINL